jgi:hypothetical protein
MSAASGTYTVVAMLTMVAFMQLPAASHDRAFWQRIVTEHYAVPAGESPAALAQELSGLLSSPDPELRDTLGYSILAVWIDRQVLAEPQLISLLNTWEASLHRGLGETNSNSVFSRSFSALCLASLAERDLKTPFLGPVRYRTLLDATFSYLGAERDLRGHDATKGWMHATAHTADLLKALARNPLFVPTDQPRLLAAVATRLSSAPDVFTQGEQDRLARAVVAIVLRRDFDVAGFDTWVGQLRTTIRQSWRTSPLTPAALATGQNGTYFLQALFARLSMETLTAGAAPAQGAVLNALR